MKRIAKKMNNKKRSKAKSLHLKDWPMQEKLGLIREIIGEAVVFEIGLRKSGEFDLLSMKTYFNEEERETPEISYVG
ncbi:MAG: hypothetical protein ABIC95_06070 [archaeon]